MSDDVILNQLDNQLGLVDDGGRRGAIVACATGGPIGEPAIYARKSDVVAAFTSGRLVEAACWVLDTTGRPVVLCRADKTTDGGYGTIDDDGVTGTVTITAHSATKPLDDYEARIDFVAGGTVGTTGITYRWSLDDGRTQSAETALGTALTLTIAEAGVALDLDTGETVVAGDYVRVRTTGPAPNATQLGDAMTALEQTENQWEICLVDAPIDASLFGAITSAATSMEANGLEPRFLGAFRVPDIGETEAQYKTAFDTIFSTLTSRRACIGFGSSENQSPISQRRYLTRLGADMLATVLPLPLGRDPARVGNGPRPATVSITERGNPKHHDEALFPGADDSRASTYRSRRRKRGVYWKNIRVLSETGSDFRYWQHLDVMSTARRIVRDALEDFSSDDVEVTETTGYIVEEEAAHIDEVVNAALATGLGNAVSAVEFKLSRTDNILSTFKLRGALRVTPLGYVKFFEVDVGFYNPALNVVFGEAA